MNQGKSILGMTAIGLLLCLLTLPRVFASEPDIIFGIQVMAPEEWKSPGGLLVRFEARQAKPKDEARTSKDAIVPIKDGTTKIELKYLRPILNLDLYAVEIKSGNKLPIGKVYRDRLAVVVRVPISNFDRLQAAKDELYLFLWDQEKQAWVRADIHKDVLKYDPGEDFISFQVKDWPLLDREIAAGG